MKLKVLGLALATLFISGGVAAMADTTVVKTESVGFDYSGAGGTDMSGSGGLKGDNRTVIIEKPGYRSDTYIVKHRHPRRAVYNSQVDLSLPHII
jgi:hypothetical protein